MRLVPLTRLSIIHPITGPRTTINLYSRKMATATRGSKRQRTSNTSEPYELLYWPGLPGRGEHIRLAFEASGTPYTDVTNEDKDSGMKTLLSYIKPSADSTDEHNPPPFAPPFLRHGSFVLAQTPSILLYLGPKLDLAPPMDEDPEGVYHVNSLTLTALDGLSNEPHDVHHPVAIGAYYEEQKAEALRKAADYRENRLPKFMDYFERVLASPASGGGEYLYGGRLTYADLVLFQTLDGVHHAFPNRCAAVRESGKYSKVYALYDRVKALPKVKAYLESERRKPYGMGIYRHYPELDD